MTDPFPTLDQGRYLQVEITPIAGERRIRVNMENISQDRIAVCRWRLLYEMIYEDSSGTKLSNLSAYLANTGGYNYTDSDWVTLDPGDSIGFDDWSYGPWRAIGRPRDAVRLKCKGRAVERVILTPPGWVARAKARAVIFDGAVEVPLKPSAKNDEH